MTCTSPTGYPMPMNALDHLRAIVEAVEVGQVSKIIAETKAGRAYLATLDATPTYDTLANLNAQPGDVVEAPEQIVLHEIAAELTRARTKVPGRNVTFAALVEEVGELATATFEESRANVRKEAIQVAVMAIRMILDGDHTFDAWRAMKGLDALVDSATPDDETQQPAGEEE